jgi:hypothetical protein
VHRFISGRHTAVRDLADFQGASDEPYITSPRGLRIYPKVSTLNPISAKIVVRRLDERMAFVPEEPAVWTFATPPNGVGSADIVVQAAAV